METDSGEQQLVRSTRQVRGSKKLFKPQGRGRRPLRDLDGNKATDESPRKRKSSQTEVEMEDLKPSGISLKRYKQCEGIGRNMSLFEGVEASQLWSPQDK